MRATHALLLIVQRDKEALASENECLQKECSDRANTARLQNDRIQQNFVTHKALKDEINSLTQQVKSLTQKVPDPVPSPREDLVETVVDATRGLCCFMDDSQVQEFEKGISAAIKDAYEGGIDECPFAELKRLREENAIIKGQTWQTVQLCDVVKRLSEVNVRLEKELSGKKDELAHSTFWGKKS